MYPLNTGLENPPKYAPAQIDSLRQRSFIDENGCLSDAAADFARCINPMLLKSQCLVIFVI